MRLATLTAETLQQIAIYDTHCLQEERLRNLWQTSPLPAAVHSPAGELLLANAQYQTLGLERVESVTSPDESGWREVTIDNPPRTFVLMEAPITGTESLLTVYREVTEERNAPSLAVDS